MTAVEILYELWCKNRGSLIPEDFQEAKETEEQQIKTAYGSGIETMRKSFSINSHIPKRAQEYYNDTFNK